MRPWEFLSAVGKRAGVFGRESGEFEVWVYPLKILRNFNLTFHVAGQAIPSESLARTVAVRPESCTIVYVGDSFSARETLFVPVEEPGAIIALDIETAEPLAVEVSFERDFQLMWPAALGGTYLNWNGNLRAFMFGEEQRRFFALVGSPAASEARSEYRTNYTSSPLSSFRLEAVGKGRQRRTIVIAASVESQAEAEKTYQALAADFDRLQGEAARYYRDYLERTIRLDLPDPALQQAYDWARVSVLQGVVNNPFLGTGLIAGYGLSGDGTRPGFAWFFGRDALWTAFALNAAGDFATVRKGLEFLIQHQRADGKLPHEVSQSARFVPWFENYPYGYASADATPLFILAVDDYVRRSGDVAFAQENWPSLWKAHEFLRSTWDPRGLAQNHGVGHGWVEGGPLLPVKTELYLSGLGGAALHALANLARLTGRKEIQDELEQEFARQKMLLNQAFWLPEKRIFAFALDKDGRPVDEASVLATVPMWFDLLEAEKANAMISELADANHGTDWGMRIISSESAKFHPAGYHFGSVWPLFTGWAAVGMYRQHRSFPAHANLQANAGLALDGALGHVTEVLSGSSYAPLSTSSPHQIWSAAMIISPLL
ncbi:MAG: amylo-alpha-1,6-glucosidase, partial [Acidobacteria bacterium]|nr:amylo-alpha-1,6-glucosidase [Acidobacteriota bacterium]